MSFRPHHRSRIACTFALVALTAVAPACAQSPAPVRAPAVEYPTAPPPPYVTPDTPQGSGAYPALMLSDPGLATHTIYRPKDLNALGSRKLPIVVFANGACSNIGNMFRYFLTEIASHGFLAIATGPIGAKEDEFVWGRPHGSPAPGSPAALTIAAGEQVNLAGGRISMAVTTPALLTDAMNWAQAENSRKGSPYFGRLDAAQIAVMGMSCGGLQAIDAAHDPRVKALGVWNSGAFTDEKMAEKIAAAKATKAALATLRVPAIYVSGNSTDVAFANAEDDVNRLAVPVVRAWREQTGHVGTYHEPNAGSFGKVAVAWLRWQLMGDQSASRMFLGPDCELCKQPDWHVRTRNFDK